MPQRRVTIGDVAEAAGVSVATVSKVINDRYGVSSATATRVKAVVSDLGYESSLIARSLRSHRTHVVGILVADIEPFSAELLKGAARAIKTSGYELIVYSGSGHGVEHAGWERRNVSRLSGTLDRRDHPRHPDRRRPRGRRADRRRRPAHRCLDDAQRACRQPGWGDHRHRVSHRPRPPADRLPRRPPRPRLGSAARAGLSRRPGHRRHRRGPELVPRRRVRARDVRSSRPASCSSSPTRQRRSSRPTTCRRSRR